MPRRRNFSSLAWSAALPVFLAGCSGESKTKVLSGPVGIQAPDAEKTAAAPPAPAATEGGGKFANPKPGLCPVSGEEVDESVTAEVNGRGYLFCCAKCVDEFKADPAKYLGASASSQKPPCQEPAPAAETQAVLFGRGAAHSLKIPKSWKSQTPANKIRLFQAAVPRHTDDTEDAEFIVSKASGGVETNLARWAEKLFGGAETLKRRRALKTAGGREAAVAEYEGTYTAMQASPEQAAPKQDYKMLGAIVVAEDAEYFIRLTGPRLSVEQAAPAFEPLVLSFQ